MATFVAATLSLISAFGEPVVYTDSVQNSLTISGIWSEEDTSDGLFARFETMSTNYPQQPQPGDWFTRKGKIYSQQKPPILGDLGGSTTVELRFIRFAPAS